MFRKKFWSKRFTNHKTTITLGTVACRGVKAVAIAALLAGVFRLTNSELVSGGLFDSAEKRPLLLDQLNSIPV